MITEIGVAIWAAHLASAQKVLIGLAWGNPIPVTLYILRRQNFSRFDTVLVDSKSGVLR